MQLSSKYRSHTCGELRSDDSGKKVTISGWVDTKRNHGGVMFVDLRDHYGITQIVVDESRHNVKTSDLDNIHLESVICVTGTVTKRSAETIRSDIKTGEIEVFVEKFEVISHADHIPFQVNDDESTCNEELRLKYRFLDLRRDKIHKNIVLRSRVIQKIRDFMISNGFTEFQTPILTASSPEGARDFLVPSRLHPGKFYALPQAPQQFKQLLMISGFDRYFQIAPCFRDEDARADRSPGEFYQLDVEMSFVEQKDIFGVIEPMMIEIFSEFSDWKVDSKFPMIPYNEAMLKYGSDKPDLRNPIINSDATDIFANSGFSIFAKNIASGSVVRAIPAPNTSGMPRSFFDNMISYAQENGASGLAYIVFDQDGTAKGPIAKLLSEDELNKIKTTAKLSPGDSVFFSCDKEGRANKIAGLVRSKLGNLLNIVEKNTYRFCWVVDFPYFEWNETENKIDFSHNPFSMPQGGMDVLINAASKDELLQIKAYQYDIVCNGIELSSGAIRNHSTDIMYKAFEIAGYSKNDVDSKFGGMIKAFKYGAPPHGGIAPGIDRIVMLLADTDNIREVIAFPMNGKAEDLLMSAPNFVTEKQLRELHIGIKEKK